MISIELKDVRLYARHGFYKDEPKTGNVYHVDLCVKYEERNAKFDTLTDTINYVELYDIIRQRMQTPTALLEKLCDEIIQQIKTQYPFIAEAMISVYKIQAPIQNFEGKVGVSLHKIFNG
ncbi:MAG TPA: dihydroneopterin aldolase [Flavitalea sp.]|nr:dihydroneopterin aldolase [Flavitalea sp.]